jgi:hypothetical protein
MTAAAVLTNSTPPWAVNICCNNSNITQTINVYEGWQRPELYFNLL